MRGCPTVFPTGIANKAMNSQEEKPRFEIVHESVVYKRYLQVFDRHTRFPVRKEKKTDWNKGGEIVKWDIVAHSFNESNSFVCVFPFDTKKVSVSTLIG